MKNTAKRKPNNVAFLRNALPLQTQFDQEDQVSQKNSFALDHVLNSEIPFESAPPQDSEVASELEDLFDLEISSLRWDDDQPEFHPEID